MERTPFYQRALAAIELKRWDVARRELTRSLADNPQDPRALSLMAACSFNLHEVATAIEQSKLAINADPTWTHSYYVLSLCYTSLKRFKEAETAIREAMLIEPENPDFLMVLANLQFAKMSWEAGLALLEQGLAVDPGHASCLRLTAYGLRQLGRLADAEEVVKKALSLHPEDARLYAEAGWTAIRTDANAAEEHFGEALRLNPGDKSYIRGMKEAQFQSKWFFRLFRHMFSPWVCVPYYGLWLVFSTQVSAEIATVWLYGPIIFLLIGSIVNAIWEGLCQIYASARSWYESWYQGRQMAPRNQPPDGMVTEGGTVTDGTCSSGVDAIFSPNVMATSLVARQRERRLVSQAPRNVHPLITWTLKHRIPLIAIVVICSIVRLLVALMRGN